MHAASVHPEPGSNSRMFVLNVPIGTFNLDPSYDLALLLFVRVRFFIAKKRNCRDSEDALFYRILLFRTI